MEEKKEQELVRVQEERPLILQEGLLTEDIVKQAELQVEGIKKIKILAIRVTNENDWCDQQGKPYLENMGSMKVAQLFGVSFKDRNVTPEEFTDDKGKYLMFTCSGKAVFKGRVVEDIGTCSTRDAFFGMKDHKYKAYEEVDLENVKKKSVTNWQNRILKKILGLGFTWEDLAQAGLDINKIKKVKYTDNKNISVISEPQLKRMFALMKDNDKGEEEVKKYLTENYPYTEGHRNKVRKSDYEDVCTWIGEFKNKAGDEDRKSIIEQINKKLSVKKVTSKELSGFINEIAGHGDMSKLTKIELQAVLQKVLQKAGERS